MIVVMTSPGRLGNKLFLFAHFIAFGIEHRCAIVNLSFEPYEKYFAPTRQICLCPFPAYLPMRGSVNIGSKGRANQTWLEHHLRSTFLRLAWRLYHASDRSGFSKLLQVVTDEDRGRKWDMSGREFIGLASSTRVLMTNGWLFRDRPALRKHANVVRRFFLPIEPHISSVSSIVGRARVNADLLIGVHIRRGDYRTFLDGVHFFEFEQYADIMRNITSLYVKNRIAFLICSDEPIPLEPFRGLNIHLSSGHLVEDVYALAECDLLVGPWSTYCAWASFYGSVPWYRIGDPRALPQPDRFLSIHDIWTGDS
jgi:hypothetical protein